MYGGRVEGIVAVADAQEAGALLERARTQPGDVEQLPAPAERAVLVAVVENVLLAQPGRQLGIEREPGKPGRPRGSDEPDSR